jgi:mono/diheme cytochrome c family protein
MRRVLVCCILSLGLSPPIQAEQKDELSSKAAAILRTHCHRCHGQNGSVEGGFNYVLDLAKLAERKKVAPGNPAESPLLRRIKNGSMPPAGEHPRPTAAEIGVLTKWIESGATTTNSTPTRKAITSDDVQSLILADLEKIDRRGRRFQRYSLR